LPEVVRASSTTPARVLGRPDLADLAPGSTGDATILELQDGEFSYEDVTGATMTGRQRLALRAVVLGGNLWHQIPGAR
jgi:dihydroorotase